MLLDTSKKNSETNIKTSYKRDESDNLINKLFSVFKTHIIQLKNNITIKKEKLRYINSCSNYANSIVNNIIKHNYSFEQLKSLEDTIVQIKEQSNICNNNILEEEQSLKLFTGEIKNLLKTLNILFKKKCDDYSDKKLNCIKNGNDSNLKNDLNYNFVDPFFLYKTKNIQKRTKSQGNRESIKNQNNSTNKSQRSMTNKNNSFFYIKSDPKLNKTKSVLNDNRNINYLKIKKNNLDKAQSTYNIEINKKNLMNNCSTNLSEFSFLNSEFNTLNYKNLLSKYSEIKKQNEEYEKSLKYLKKQILNYKKIIELMNKQSNNKEIIEKTKQISLLNCQVQNLKKKLENKNSKSIVNIHKNNRNLKCLDTDNMDTYESDANNNTGLSGNCIYLSNREKDIKLTKKEKLKTENLLLTMKNNYKNKSLDKESNFIIINLKNKIKQYEIEINNLKEKIKNQIDKNKELNSICQNQKINFENEITKINDKRYELSKLFY